MKTVIQAAGQEDAGFIVTGNSPADRQKAFRQMGAGVSVERSNNPFSLTASTRYKDILPNVSIRDSMTREDYDWFRPNEQLPRSQRGMVIAAMGAYDQNPIVHNVIDLMSDFASHGIHLAHKVKKYDKIYKHWAKLVNMRERSERFCNLLLKAGQAPVLRSTAKLKPSDVKKLTADIGGQIGPDIEGLPPKVALGKREIPFRYTFVDPTILEPIGPYYGFFTVAPSFGIIVDPKLRRVVNSPKTDDELQIAQAAPEYIKQAINANLKVAPLDPEKFSIYYYKRDDWTVFAYPMVTPILNNLLMIRKMELADMSALDGAISRIRIIKLGDLDKGIIPGPGAISALNDMLMNQVPGGTTDIIWNPAIDLLESKSDQVAWLDPKKYEYHLACVYAGLGIPPSLTGSGGDGGGLTNNFISMKTLLERLEYVQTVLKQFWHNEAKLFQQAMGIPTPPEVICDHMSLSDESAEKALWVQLVQMRVVSLESIRHKFGLSNELENARLQREAKAQDGGKVPPMLGPFADTNSKLSLEKIALQTGLATPSQVGLDLEDPKPGEKTLLELQKENAPKAGNEPAPKGKPGQGRPKNQKDTKPRDQRSPKPATSSVDENVSDPDLAVIDRMFWARSALAQVDKIIFPAYLATLGKEEGDDLSFNQRYAYERALFCMVSKLSEDQLIDSDLIRQEIDHTDDWEAESLWENQAHQFFGDGVPNLDRLREMESLLIALS